MSLAKRRTGLAFLAMIACVVPGQAVEGQEREESRPRSRFLTFGSTVINLDQITTVTVQDINGAIEGVKARAHVEFGATRYTYVYNDVKTLLDALKGDGPDRSSRPEAAPGSRVLLRDDFDGKLTLNWKPVRPDPSHVSLTKSPGKLVITTRRGTIHGHEGKDEAGGDVAARNLYLIDNPLAGDGDFVVTTCVSGFTPDAPFQQAGLIVYGDDDNYLKWGYEYFWNQGGGQIFRCVTEVDAQPTHHDGDATPGLARCWLRLTKRGNTYEYASSLDRKAYKIQGEATWGDGAPRRVGILAKNGGVKEAADVDAAFEFFELRTPATSEKAAPATPARE